MAFEENEISINAKGGTELIKREIAARMPEGLADDFQVICSRVRKIEEDKIRILWVHDLPEDPELSHLADPKSRERFHKIVFCGHWQYNGFINKLNIPVDDRLLVIDNPVVPIEFVEKDKDEIRLIYTSTPHRGLEILVPVFQELCKKHDNIKLDVFSSFKIYGWEDADKSYEPLYDICRNHPKIIYHGSQDNETVRKALQKAHIFSYPSIWQECNSRAMIEAMSAGLLCVHPNYAGLSDTGGGLTSMYQWVQDPNQHAHKFLHILDNAINIVNEDSTQKYLKLVKVYADNRFNMDAIAKRWENLLKLLKMQYPTVESRKLPEDVFVYKS